MHSGAIMATVSAAMVPVRRQCCLGMQRAMSVVTVRRRRGAHVVTVAADFASYWPTGEAVAAAVQHGSAVDSHPTICCTTGAAVGGCGASGRATTNQLAMFT